ncbi:MarR family transcriptional regulator [Cytophagales bacterium LB-30]|uniref:MarR family transcriptional regulator n=1 Tax=Shiella aurantiaca TaxID=3058365 RepID=A0ABT8F0Q9_9BACT|nr:MarR family transcriptional regulator [Shiella aurantiaca]MDN4164032.1 MarR family transcriptional regulator [Shiella aurantiaca]
MRIEEEIKQKKFKSPYHKAALNVLFTASWINGKNNALLKPYSISPQQYNVMRILRGQHPKPVSVTMIQARMLDKSSNASRLVDKLLKQELIMRAVCENDRRQVEISLTDKGMLILGEIDEKMDKTENHLAKLSPDEAMMLSYLLDKLRG